MLELRVAKQGRKTGEMLREVIQQNGITVGQGGEAVVSYGVPLADHRPNLNAEASRLNKYAELVCLRDAGVRTVPVSRDGSGLSFPILGRNLKHMKGKDILPVLADDVTLGWRRQAGCSDYYTQYIPHQAEYRVWIFRDKRLASYRKVLRYPEKYKRHGCSWVNGFAFEYTSNLPDGLSALASRSVAALGYDFGAVDILQGQDGSLYVLEVNSAPGQDTVRKGVANLAAKIVAWVAEGYPNREDGGDIVVAGRTNPTGGHRGDYSRDSAGGLRLLRW